MWTWMHGPQYGTDTAGSAGTIGVPSASNVPKALNSYYWYDINHDYLWLWQPSTNKLWRYHGASNMWTWMADMPVAVSFGTKGVAAPSNNPGGLADAGTWCDTAGNLFLVGGQGYLVYNPITTNTEPLQSNNIWKYDVNSQMWTWMKGDSIRHPSSIPGWTLGTKGVESPSNRMIGGSGMDVWQGQDGMVYVTTGPYRKPFSYILSQPTTLFRYNPQTNNCTWMSGDGWASTANYCEPNTIPLEKEYGTATTTSLGACSSDLLWRFGGHVGNFTGAAVGTHCNICNTSDLYVYSPSGNVWKLVSGSSLSGGFAIAGIQGVPDVANKPEGVTDAAMWSDSSGNIWLFGGKNFIYGNIVYDYPSNLLWRYRPNPDCVNIELPATPLSTNIVSCFPYDSTTMNIPNIFTNINIIPSTGVTFNVDTSQLVFKPVTTTTYTLTAQNNYCNNIDIVVFTINVVTSNPNTPCFNFVTDTVLCRWGGPWNTQLSISPEAYNITVSPMDSVSFNVDSTLITFNPSLVTHYTVTAHRTCSLMGGDTIDFNVIADTAHALGPLTGGIICSLNDTIFYVASDTLTIKVGYRSILFNNSNSNNIWLDTTDWTIKIFSVAPINFNDLDIDVITPSTNSVCQYKFEKIKFNLVPFETSGPTAVSLSDTILCSLADTPVLYIPDFFNIVSITPSTGFTFNADSSLVHFHPDTTTTYSIYTVSRCGGTIRTFTIHSTHPALHTIFANSYYGKDTLTITPSAQAYQWISCIDNMPLTNDTNQYLHVNQNGMYAAIVYNGLCVDTTNCITISHFDGPVIHITPNPSQSLFNIYSSVEFINADVKVFSSAGNTILEKHVNNKNHFSLDLSSSSRGVYFIHIIEDSRVYRAKLIRE